MRVSEQLARAAIILKDTSHPGNIGAAARAMRAMGVSRLICVAAKTRLDSTSRAMAAGAIEILEAIEWRETLPPALAGFTHVYAYSARRRDLSPRCLRPRQAAEEAMQAAGGGGRAAFLFGGERSGLENADVQQATAIVEVPANPLYPSLNLAQAVQIACYELRLAAGAGAQAADRRDMPPREEFDAMIMHLQEALTAVGLPKKNDTRPLLARLRNLLTRADLDAAEVRLLRGVWRAMIQAAKDKP